MLLKLTKVLLAFAWLAEWSYLILLINPGNTGTVPSACILHSTILSIHAVPWAVSGSTVLPSHLFIPFTPQCTRSSAIAMGIAVQSENCLFHFKHLHGNSGPRFIPAFAPGKDKNKSFILKCASISKWPAWFYLLPPASSNDSWKKESVFFSIINLKKKDDIFFFSHFRSFYTCTRFKRLFRPPLLPDVVHCQTNQTYCETRFPVILKYSCHLNSRCCKQAVAGRRP